MTCQLGWNAISERVVNICGFAAKLYHRVRRSRSTDTTHKVRFKIDNGIRPSGFSFSGNHRHRVSLFVGRSCRGVRLYRDNDVVWACTHDHSSDCARAEHFGRHHRHIPILARRIFFVEIVLAIRAALDSNRLFWRPFTTVCFSPKNFDRAGTNVLGRAFDFSAQRPSENCDSITTYRDRCGSRPRISLRADRHRRRNFSYAASVILPMGADSTGRRGFGAVHFGKFDRRIGRLFHRSSFHPIAWTFSRRRCHYRRHTWLASRQSTFPHSHNFNFAGNCADDRRHQINFHEIRCRGACPHAHASFALRLGTAATTPEAEVAAPSRVTMDCFCNRTQQFDRHVRA